MTQGDAISFTRTPKGERVQVAADGTRTFPDGSKLVPPHVGAEPAGGATRVGVSYLRTPKGERVQVAADGTCTFPDGWQSVPPQGG